jgi:hypothetical protein
MGGDIARTMTVLRTFRGANTFGAGSIHKVITLDTPHQGSQLATRLLSRTEPTECIRLRLAEFGGSFTYESVAMAGFPGAVSGAVGDLVDAPRSLALQAIAGPGAVSLPTAMFAGFYTDFDSLKCTVCAANVIRHVCKGNPLAAQLTKDGWPAIFGGPNDAIVSETSQHNGGTAGTHATGLLHSAGAQSLSFSGPSVLEDRGVGDLVLFLLNTPSTNRQQFVMVP